MGEWLKVRFELSRSGEAQGNNRPMEGLRGFAVLLVFVVHYTGMTRPWLGTGASSLYVFSEALHTIGNVGVDLFFVLSGYLIYGSLIARHQPFRTFMSRRIQRIYPTFLTVFAIYLILSWFLPAESKLPAILFDKIIYLIENLLLLPGLFPIQPLITVAWSLSYEMAYYLILPLLMILLNMRIRSPEWRSAFLINAAILIAVSCVFSGGPIRLIMFVVGMLIFESRKLGHDGRHGDVTGFAGLVVGLGCTLIPLEGSWGLLLKEGSLFLSFWLFCGACFRVGTALWIQKVFSWTALRWLGNMSYSYYLIHGLVLKAGFLGLLVMFHKGGYSPPILYWSLFFPLMFLLTLLPAAVLFLMVERPLSLSKSTQCRPVLNS